MHARFCLCLCLYLYLCCACVYVRVCVCAYACACVCVCLCLCVCVRVYASGTEGSRRRQVANVVGCEGLERKRDRHGAVSELRLGQKMTS